MHPRQQLLKPVAEPGLLQSLGKKNLQHIYRCLHKKLQANNQKSKEIAQFIDVYIRNSEEFT